MQTNSKLIINTEPIEEKGIQMTTLRDLKPGMTATITAVGGEGNLRQQLLDMGLIPDAKVTLVKYAPLGDPMELKIQGYELTLRLADAEKVQVDSIEASPLNDGYCVTGLFDSSKSCKYCRQTCCAHRKNSATIDTAGRKPERTTEHPGLGEGGRYHVKADENPIPEGETLTFAIAGNQNSGKTTLFNALAGANEHVGNFPGITVEKTQGKITGHKDSCITDLPGIYSMSAYAEKELESRNFILDNNTKAIINVVDATNIERNLYLTMQLMELGKPMVLALNMMDEFTENGGYINVNEMEAMLGIPVVPVSAAKGQGIRELTDHAIHIARYQERPGRQDFCGADENGGAVHRCLHGIMHLIEDHAEKAGLPMRFAAARVAEGDTEVLNSLELTENEKEAIEHLLLQMEEERNLDRAAAMAEMRFNFIGRICSATVVKPVESRQHEQTRKLDRILTGKYTAIPSFILIMGTVFFLTFNVIGSFLQGLLANLISDLSEVIEETMAAGNVNEVIQSLVLDGVMNGVGVVISFLPIIVTLFFFLSILEDSGYMARVAFFMDRFLRKIGLSGRSIVPMLIGFGCSVPSIMATRTLPSERDRKMTILLIPYMSCSAKLPLYAFFTAAFFPDYGGLVMICLYLTGIIVGILMALILKKTLFKGGTVPFIMELPSYRLPAPKNVAMLLWDKARDFLQRAFSVILVATLIIWFLQTFDMQFNVVTDSQDSILARISGVIAPIFSPMGFGDWRISTALVTGFIGKEIVVATLAVLFGAGVGITSILTPLAALSLLAFCLLYTPCVAAIASVKNELGLKWAIIICFGQCAVAWVVAFAVAMIGSIFI